MVRLALRVGLIWATLAGFVITLLEPLGGIDVFLRVAGTRGFVYSNLLVGAFLVAATYVSLTSRNTVRGAGPASSMRTGGIRTTSLYANVLKDAGDQVCVLGLSLPSFQMEDGLDLLASALKGGASVRILLMNPLSPGTLQRPREVYRASDHVQDAAVHTISCLLRLRSQLPEPQRVRFAIALMPILPGVAVVASEDRLMWSPYLSTSSGAKSPFELFGRRDSPAMFDVMMGHFEASWSMSLRVQKGTSIEDLVTHLEGLGLAPAALDQASHERLHGALTGGA
ncbi:MAG: hypothetical protein LC667_11850 [Thioalkalivibrio sp.]|nr:hypothetical protein [Thioalkalivibrio sp.]